VKSLILTAILFLCPVYDAEEIKKQEQQEAIKKLYPKKKGVSFALIKKRDNPHHPAFLKS